MEFNTLFLNSLLWVKFIVIPDHNIMLRTLSTLDSRIIILDILKKSLGML